MFTASRILNLLSIEESIDKKKLEKALKCSKKNERTKLEIAIKALEKLSIIDLDEDGNLTLNPDNDCVKATIRCSSKGYCFAVREDGGDDIYIREHFLNHSWHGDSVLIKVIKEAERRKSPEGIVQCILNRNTSSLICIIKEEASELIAHPLDDRILEDIKLRELDRKYLTKDENKNIVEVKINSYPIAQHNCYGEILRALPLDNGDLGDIEILLTKSNLNKEIVSPKVTLKDLSSSKRKDLTSQECLLFKSWTSDTSPDLPALFVEPLSTGNRVWIHTHAISERYNITGKLDKWLRDRGEAICLGTFWRTLHSEEVINASKFTPEEVNEAVSISIDINNKGEIINWEFCLSRIKPKCFISYPQFEAISKRKPRARTIPNILKPVKDYINQVQTIIFLADKLNSQDHSELEISSDLPMIDSISEMYWEHTGRNFRGWKKCLTNTDPQSILNTYIKAANKIWFKHSYLHNIPSITTENNKLEPSKLNDLIKSALSLNLDFQLDDNGFVNPSEFLESVKDFKHKRIFHKIIKQIIKDKDIKVSSDLISEDLLQLKETKIKDLTLQSPWCNPILFYLDLMNQHSLVLLLKDGKNKRNSRDKNLINLGLYESWDQLDWPLFSNTSITQLTSVNSQENLEAIKVAKHKIDSLSSDIISMAKSRKASLLIGKELEGIITAVQSYGFFAEIPPLMIEGLVHVSTLNDDWYEYRSRQNLLIGRKNKKHYKLGDEVILEISKVDLLRNQVDLIVKDKIEPIITTAELADHSLSK